MLSSAQSELIEQEGEQTPPVANNFRDRALPLIKRGIPVIPLVPKGKKALIEDWPNKASTNRKQIEAWASQWPEANVGCVATYGYCYLDDDRGDLKERIEQETGRGFPRTFTVLTSVKSTGLRGRHYYFNSNAESILLGNARLPAVFDFQAEGTQVVGPYSVHHSGVIYTPVDPSAPIADIPDWLLEWIEQNRKHEERSDGDEVVAHEEWDSGAWCDHYQDVFTLSLPNADGWQASSICPLTWQGGNSGHRHSGSELTGFRFSQSAPEFHCFSTDSDDNGNPHDQASFGDVVKHLNKYHEPYKGKIWAEPDLDDWDIELEADIARGAALGEGKEEPELREAQAEETVRLDSDGNAYVQEGDGNTYVSVPAPEKQKEPEKPATEPLHEPEEFILLGSSNKQPVYAAITSMDKVIPKPLEWLWEQRLLRNYLNIFGGLPEQGKSLCTMDIIGTITTGRDWPDGATNTMGPKNVILLQSEDGLADVVWARLTAAKADLSRVKAWKGVICGEENRKNKKKRMVSFKQDMKALRRLLKLIPDVALLVVDPISSYYGVDANKVKEVKPVLDELRTVCEEAGIALVAVAHFSKRSDVDALQRVSGDVSVGGSARMMWTFSQDPDTENEYLMTSTKGNHARRKTGLRYRIAEEMVRLTDGTVQSTPRMEWLGSTDLRAQDVLDKQREKSREGRDGSKVNVAIGLLQSRVPDKAAKLFGDAEKMDISEKTLRRAKDKLGLVALQRDPHGAKASCWWWYAPDSLPRKLTGTDDPLIPDDGVM